MENVKNDICNIFIDDSYCNFSKCFDNDLNKIYDEILIITDDNVYNHQLELFTKTLNSKILYEYVIPSGEYSKSLDVYETLINYIIKINLSRKSLIIALGGGVVGDLAGFVASTYMRGIDFCIVPTTLLSQVDSSVGGKVGINIGNFKNIIGSFYQPKLTYININSLNTLCDDDFLSGMSEVIKYGIIYDYSFLYFLKVNSGKILNKEKESIYYIIKKCVEIKSKIVLEDEKESGLRKILNFGHTFAHGLENLLHISHGYAVSIGMSIAFKLAFYENLIEKNYYDYFLEVLSLYNLPISFYSDDKDIENKILQIIKSDKKNNFGKINFILPIKYGVVREFNNVSYEKIISLLREFKNA